jgi:uncharacterized protein (UPF0332 family)
MKSLSFFDKLKQEGKLELIEPSEPMAESYERKSRDCLTAAKLLFGGNLYENAIGEAYYSMYNAVQSLFFKCGIKCENHSAAALPLKKLYKTDKIFITFSEAKKERIDKQYYTTQMQERPVTKESAQALIRKAETFILEVGSYKRNLKLKEIDEIRKNFKSI